MSPVISQWSLHDWPVLGIMSGRGDQRATFRSSRPKGKKDSTVTFPCFNICNCVNKQPIFICTGSFGRHSRAHVVVGPV